MKSITIRTFRNFEKYLAYEIFQDIVFIELSNTGIISVSLSLFLLLLLNLSRTLTSLVADSFCLVGIANVIVLVIIIITDIALRCYCCCCSKHHHSSNVTEDLRVFNVVTRSVLVSRRARLSREALQMLHDIVQKNLSPAAISLAQYVAMLPTLISII